MPERAAPAGSAIALTSIESPAIAPLARSSKACDVVQ
jgi:hypothetical protein